MIWIKVHNDSNKSSQQSTNTYNVPKNFYNESKRLKTIHNDPGNNWERSKITRNDLKDSATTPNYPRNNRQWHTTIYSDSWWPTMIRNDQRNNQQRSTATQEKFTLIKLNLTTTIHNDYRKDPWLSTRIKEITRTDHIVAVCCFSSFLYYVT